MAVLSVVIYHAGFTVFGERLLPGGFLGVDVFFVISGYLIGLRVLRDVQAGRFSFIDFYERRIRRILPALLVLLLTSLALGWFLLLPQEFVELAGSAVASLTFWSNFFFWRMGGYASEANELRPLLHTWSLAIEEQFYLLLPAAVMLIGMHWRRIGTPALLLGTVVSLFAAELCVRTSTSAVFYLLPTRSWELGVGLLLADAELRGLRIRYEIASIAVVGGMTALILSIVLVDNLAAHPGLITLPAVIGTAAIIACAKSRADFVSRILGSSPFVAIGLISYSVYLWHQPIFAFTRLTSVNVLSPALLVALTLTSLVVGWLSWRFIELPFRNRALCSTKAIWTATVVVGSVILVGGAGIAASGGFPERLPPIIAAADPAPQWWQLENDGTSCHDNTTHRSCHFDLEGKQDNWALIGDSHAGTLGPALLDGLRPLAKSLDVLTWGGCPVIFDVDYKVHPDGDLLPCFEHNEFVRRFLHSSNPMTVVYGARMPLWMNGTRFDNQEGGVELGTVNLLATVDGDDRQIALKRSVTDTLNEIAGLGHHVIIVYPVPEVGWNVPRSVKSLIPKDLIRAQLWMNEQNLTTSLAVYMERSASSRAAYDAVQSSPNLTRIHPAALLCDEVSGRCRTYDHTNFFYSDDDHLSRAGADLIVGAIISSLEIENRLH